MARSAEVESYLADAQRWDQDLVAKAEASRRRAYWVASAFGGLATLALLGACTVGPKYVRPSVATPPAYKEAGEWKIAQPRDEVFIAIVDRDLGAELAAQVQLFGRPGGDRHRVDRCRSWLLRGRRAR